MKHSQNPACRALLILGMHRSGTSAAARVVNLLGAELGQDLVPAGPDNPEGFWEHAEAVGINDAILQGLGRTWYDMRDMPDGWMDSPCAKVAEQRIGALIEHEFAASSLCAVKDPRMCLTAPLWIKVFEARGFEVDCLFLTRDPWEVVESLHQRNDWPRAPLFLMWIQYIMEATAASEQKRRAMITYDQLVSDWRGSMKRVARALHLRWPVAPDSAQAKAVDAFLDPGLRHHQRPSPGMGGERTATPDLAETLHQACQDIASGEGQWTALSDLQEFYRGASQIYAAHVDHLLTERWGAERRAQTAEARLAEQPAVAATVREAVQGLHEALGTRLESVERSVETIALREQPLDRRLQAVERSVDTIARQARPLDRRLESVERSVEAIARRARTAGTNVASRLEAQASATAAIHGLVKQLQQDMSALSSETAARLERQGEGMMAMETGIQRQQTHLDTISFRLEQAVHDREAERAGAADALARARADMRQLRAALASSETTIAELIASTSWKLTAPMRWLSVHVLRRSPPPLMAGSVTPEPIVEEGSRYGGEPTTTIAAYQAADGVSSAPASAATAAREGPDGSACIASPDRAARDVLQCLSHAAAEARGSEYVPMDDDPADLSKIDVRAIAFYLPQFHPIPENDKWWGRGFTEWTNVSKAVPQFVGHYQPRLPGELGFYDLRVVDVMRRQVQLARHYGLQGFCFHYYWFNGKRLLERPLQQFLDHPDIDFPFCVCWANENWSRRWDGREDDILIRQEHSPEDDLAFIASLEPLLRDPRYIHIDNRPLIVLYRPSLLPDAAATLERWREHCRRAGIGELFLAMVQFDVEDPRIHGFDAAIEFPPHRIGAGLEPINNRLDIVNPTYQGNVIEYADIIERARQIEAPDYDLIRGVFPSWDNEARMPGAGYTYAHATPRRYREWLGLVTDYARQHPVAGESMVFVNAWNEWAEGAHLEPDRRYGYAFLDQTRQALLEGEHETTGRMARRILIVSHDAHPHGAQYLALHMARKYSEWFRFEVDVVLLGEGRLRDEFARWATIHDLDGKEPLGSTAQLLARKLYASGIRHAIANTTASGLFARLLKDAGFRVTSLIHEMSGVIRDLGLLEHARTLAASADCMVFPTASVRDEFSQCIDMGSASSEIRAQGLYKPNRFAHPEGKVEARDRLRLSLGIPASARIVLCVGYADHRKGIDQFVDIGRRVMRAREDVHFLWVGHFDTTLEAGIRESVRAAGLEDRFHFPGIDPDTDLYYAGADIYALTSREDPFPSVVMEALEVEVPVVGFAGRGGFVELLERGTGVLVPAFDLQAFGNAIVGLLDDATRAAAIGARGHALVDAEYRFRGYLFDLLDFLGYRFPRVSVIVPNYNYARHLRDRIASIVGQTMPFYELIILDDASDDDSIEVIEKLLVEYGIQARLVRNRAHSGNVSRQWAKGVELARGDLVWIAEADDLCEPGFLERMTSVMQDRSVVMAYCQSRQIDAAGNVLADTYLKYTDDVSHEHWLQAYREQGSDEIRKYLAVKNTIPNVSAALFRRDALWDALGRELDTMTSFRIAGDWVAYLAVLEQGEIAFVPESLNLHRRHPDSITNSSERRLHMQEVLRVQHLVSQRYPLGPEVQQNMADYVDYLRRHFALEEAEVERLQQATMAN